MQRLTLILSDLYLPEEAAVSGSLSGAIALPSLDWLLRFAAHRERVRDWRSWLAGELGQPSLAQRPVAHGCALALADASAASTAWLATPVHLEARLDHVRLVDRGLLRLAAGEHAPWCAEFARAFGPQYSLHDAGERGFLLLGVADNRPRTVDPARLLDGDVGPALPSGAEAAELRRLGTEIEMWLHGAPLNAARERARQRRISALWLWGGGIATPDETRAVALTHALHFFGADPFIVALSRALARSNARVPAAFGDLEAPDAHAVVELAPMTGPGGESLQALEKNWFSPVRAALASGALQACDVLANDRWFRIPARPAWKFWRRHAHWLEQLAASR